MSEPDDDAVWVSSCLQGDAGAFEPLVRKYQRLLFGVAYRVVGDYEDARDVTQNAFVRAFERLDTFDPNRKFFSWLYRIAVNEGLNLRRARRPLEALPAGLEARENPMDGLEARERQDRVQAALGRLSGEHRDVVVLRHFGELSYEEIAEALDVPEKTVKSRLFSARQRLAELLAER
jgi:RNA polymerase sigma-70 factor (ECF subfamily)